MIRVTRCTLGKRIGVLGRHCLRGVQGSATVYMSPVTGSSNGSDSHPACNEHRLIRRSGGCAEGRARRRRNVFLPSSFCDVDKTWLPTLEEVGSVKHAQRTAGHTLTLATVRGLSHMRLPKP